MSEWGNSKSETGMRAVIGIRHQQPSLGHAHTSDESELRSGALLILACMVGVGVGLTGLPYYTFGTFMKPLAADLGWTRGQVAMGSLFLHSGTIVTSPFVGRFIDRYGTRRIALISLAGLAIGLLGVASSGPSLLSFDVAWMAVALLGCGTTPLTWTRIINTHFRRQRGLALGMTLMGTGLASIVGPRFCAYLIAVSSWRAAYAGLAAFILLLALPVVAFGLRERGGTRVVRAVADTGVTLKQAMATRRFWCVAVGIFLVIFAQAAAIIHLVPLLTDRGIRAASAASLAGLMGIAVVVGRLCIGSLLDRFPAPRVAAVVLPLPAIALVLLATGTGMPLTITAILLIGLSSGAEVDLLAYVSSRYFGLKHYGSIYGVLLSMFALGAALGPTAAGAVFDHTGSYVPALWGGAVLFLLGTILFATLGAYPVFAAEEGGAAEGRHGND